MADNKKSFLLYCDLIHTFKELTDAEAGKLIKHVLAYVNDENPKTDDRLLKIAFEPIKQSLKRDLKKYEDIREKKRAAGLASAEKRQQKSTGVESVEQKEQVSADSTVIDSVNVSVSVSDINNSVAKNFANTENEEKMVVKEMNKIWVANKPTYPSMIEEDYHALLQIAYLIASAKGWKKSDVISFKEYQTLTIWENTVKFINTNGSKWIKGLTLSSIAIPKNWQKVINEFQVYTESQKSEILGNLDANNSKKEDAKKGWYNSMYKTKEDYDKAVSEYLN
jgi:hypothetical protein